MLHLVQYSTSLFHHCRNIDLLSISGMAVLNVVTLIILLALCFIIILPLLNGNTSVVEYIVLVAGYFYFAFI